MNFTDSYKLSVYSEIATIKSTDFCTVKLVASSLDGKRYIKKEYAENKLAVFSVLQSFRSPFLPEIKDVIGDRIVVEEFVEGITLENFLERGVPTQKQAKMIFKCVIEALNELHKHGVVHRDVKPSNIIVKPDGRAVLVDFGISKLYNAAAENDTSLFGTVGYAPPEQFGFSLTDYRSDIYSFGVTAEKLCIKSYSRIVNKCKAFDPSKRYANAGKVIADLRGRVPIGITVAVLVFLFIGALAGNANREPVEVQLPKLPTGTSGYVNNIYSTSQSESSTQTEPTLSEITQPQTQASTQLSEPTQPQVSDNLQTTAQPQTQAQNQRPTQAQTQQGADNPHYEFSTTRRLQLFDHPKPYRVIETDEHIYSILIMNDTADERIIVPMGNGGEAGVHYVLDRNNLRLSVTDGKHKFETEFSAAQLTMGEHFTKVVMAEIVFYDITGDGVFEILPMFCHCEFSAQDGKLVKTVNSWEGYCISYDAAKGFSQCEGELRVRGSQSDNLYFGGGRIYDDKNAAGYSVSGGKFAQ